MGGSPSPQRQGHKLNSRTKLRRSQNCRAHASSWAGRWPREAGGTCLNVGQGGGGLGGRAAPARDAGMHPRHEKEQNCWTVPQSAPATIMRSDRRKSQASPCDP